MNAIGRTLPSLSSCATIPPSCVSEQSVRRMNALPQSGNASTGLEMRAALMPSKLFWCSSVHLPELGPIGVCEYLYCALKAYSGAVSDA